MSLNGVLYKRYKMSTKESQIRQVACKIRIKDIVEGKYVLEEGWQPNYIITKQGQKISRVNLIGTIIFKSADKNLSYKSMVLDDGTGSLSIRSFEEKDSISNINVGDIILLIGKLRQYGVEKYIIPEIIKKVQNKGWVELRKMEISSLDKGKKEQKDESVVEESVLEKKSNMTNRIFKLIKELDQGDGADTQEVIDKCNSKKAEVSIKKLLELGEIFEIKAGKLKILE